MADPGERLGIGFLLSPALRGQQCRGKVFSSSYALHPREDSAWALGIAAGPRPSMPAGVHAAGTAC